MPAPREQIVSSGGEVNVDGGLLVGANAGSFGTILVGPGGSLGCGFLSLGDDGDGNMVIEDGGEVCVNGLTFIAPAFDLVFQQDGGSLESGLGLQVAGRVFFFAGDSEITGDVEITGNGELRVGPAAGSIGRVTGEIINNGSRTLVLANTTLFALGQVSGTSPFEGTGLIQLNGGLSPGNGVGSIQFDCDADFGTGAQIFMELGGTVPGTQHDQVRFNDVSLAGTLNVTTVNGFQPSPGQELKSFSSNRVAAKHN